MLLWGIMCSVGYSQVRDERQGEDGGHRGGGGPHHGPDLGHRGGHGDELPLEHGDQEPRGRDREEPGVS